MEAIIELWAPVLINDGIFKDDYMVSNMGRVKHKRTLSNGKTKYFIIKPINSRRPVVKITGNGRTYSKSVAKLVLSSFQYRKGCECANITYLDGNMKNCQLSNLRYTVDKGVYKTVELEMDTLKKKHPVERKTVIKTKPVKHAAVKLCTVCKDYPCFKGMENLSTDFASEGCRRFKSRDT